MSVREMAVTLAQLHRAAEALAVATRAPIGLGDERPYWPEPASLMQLLVRCDAAADAYAAAHTERAKAVAS